MSQSGQYLIIFTLNSKEDSFRKKIRRELKKYGAKKLRGGAWVSSDLDSLLRMDTIIKLSGGKSWIFRVEKV